MIQRIQTLWLLVAAGCSVAAILLPFYAGNTSNNLYERLSGQSHFHLLILCVAVGLGSLVSIFLYKNRKRQMQITFVALLLQLLNIFLFIQKANSFVDGTYSLSSVFSFAVPVLLILALLSIRKDEQLIRSMDRLR
jgi:hypothetical protein